MKIGYARVSTNQQDLASQIEKLTDAGCEKIFSGKQSGTSETNSARLSEVIDFIREGDELIVTRLDRLGRSLSQILSTIDRIHEKKASLVTVDGSLNTTAKTPIAKAMVNLCGTFAQLERDLITVRTTEGRERAKAEGRQLGRKPALSINKQEEVRRKFKQGVSVSELSRSYQVSRATIHRYNDASSSSNSNS